MKQYWYKEAIFYTLDLRCFKDGNGDGLGDFQGLLDKFDYLVDLGINALWILPFYPTEDRDFGYDITDYCAVDPRLGTLEDFKALVAKAKEHNIHLIVDLVVNHTSDQHPWFKEAKKGKDSPYHDYYIWSEKKPRNDSKDVVFNHVESSNWACNEETGEYYYHTFYSFQPDLNHTNPAVQKEVHRIVAFWMNLGISGFRVDAVPHLVAEKGHTHFNGNPLHILHEWKNLACRHNPEALLTGECDVDPKDYEKYFTGQRLDLLSNFYANNYFFYTLATKDPKHLVKAFQTLPTTTASNGYLTFLRNHDELDLERLSHDERQQVYQAFAPRQSMRIYGRGIRRRLPPMIDNNRPLLELCFSLLFTLPGTPIIRYGEEIGMGDNLMLEQRSSVRTAMQWRNHKNAGFTTDSPSGQVWPVISGGPFGYEKVNVEAQTNDPASLLQKVKQLIAARRKAPAFGYGNMDPLPVNHKNVMAHCCRYGTELAFAVHNFSGQEVSVQITVEALSHHSFQFITGRCTHTLEGTTATVTLPPFGYGWWSTVRSSSAGQA